MDELAREPAVAARVVEPADARVLEGELGLGEREVGPQAHGVAEALERRLVGLGLLPDHAHAQAHERVVGREHEGAAGVFLTASDGFEIARQLATRFTVPSRTRCS